MPYLEAASRHKGYRIPPQFRPPWPGAVKRRPVSLHSVIASCLRQLQPEAPDAEDQGHPPGGAGSGPLRRSDLLKYALTNLLANALTFVTPGVSPQVTVKAGRGRRRVSH